MVYLTILLIDGQNQRLNGTFSALLSNFLGAFIILPYFGLRRSEKCREYRLNIFIRIFESKMTSILLMITSIALICYALIFGHLSIFLHEFQTNRFIHVMTIDFFVLSFLFPFIIDDDLKRRQNFDKNSSSFYFRLGFLPLFGPLIYLCQRQPLKQSKD